MPDSQSFDTAEHNPFRISAIEQLEWLPYPDRLETIYQYWRNTEYRAQVCGPHGCGKTTLSEHLATMARADGIEVLQLFANLQSGRCEFQAWDSQLERAEQNTIVLLDGFDHATWLQRRRWLRNRNRVLVTTHTVNRLLPVLLNMQTNADLLRSVVCKLLDNSEPHVLQSLLGKDSGKSLLQQHQGNLRDTLSLLYDRWQLLQQTQPQPC